MSDGIAIVACLAAGTIGLLLATGYVKLSTRFSHAADCIIRGILGTLALGSFLKLNGYVSGLHMDCFAESGRRNTPSIVSWGDELAAVGSVLLLASLACCIIANRYERARSASKWLFVAGVSLTIFGISAVLTDEPWIPDCLSSDFWK